jgi:hypothetical protein
VKKVWVIGLAVSALVLAACSDDDGGDVRTTSDEGSGSASASGSGSGSGSASASGSAVEAECVPVGDADSASATIAITLDEFSIESDASEVAAGSVHFAVDNAGEEPHELVIVKGVAVDDLPTDADGALDEAALPEGALIGEVESFPAGETCDGTFELEAGDYTLICNLVEEEDGAMEAHLAEGMVTALTVT